MNTEFLPGSNQAEYTPEEASLLMRLHVFNNMRWVVILGVIIVTLTAKYILHIGFPTLPVYIICVFMALYNLVLMRQVSRLNKLQPDLIVPRVRQYTYSHILLDMFALTIMLHFTGGIENPFIFFFVFHIILASIGLSYKVVYLLSTIAIALVAATVSLEFAGVIPHINLAGFAPPTQYRDTNHIAAVFIPLAILLYGSTYVTTAVAGELRKRQRQVVALREHLLAEKTGELEQASREAVREKEMQDKLSAAYRELSESHQRLKESQEQLIQAEKLTSLGQLAASIAHEVNNPLAGVLVYSQLLAKKIATDSISKEVALDYLAKMTKELTRSTKLILNLMNFAHESTQSFREVNLNDIVDRVFDIVAHTDQLQHIQVIKELEPSLPGVVADFDQLQQVCTNIIMNAIQAMPGGGNLTIRTSADSGEVKIEFQDSGVGISSENMRKLFTPFFTTKPEVKGVGLGLAVSYGIIQRHNGRIEVKSQEEEGSTFSVYLPRKND